MRFIITFLLILFVGGCATSYQSKGFTGGYTDIQLDENVFRVSFRGNGNTSRDRVSDFALLRSAELTLENGFRYFVIVSAQNQTSVSTYTTPEVSQTTASGTAVSTSAGGSSISTGTGSATTITSGGQTYSISKPSSRNIIVLFRDKPTNLFSYNAEFIMRSIKQAYDID